MTMGCWQSTPDPNDLYGSEHDNIKTYESKQKKARKENKVHPVKENGVTVENGTSNNNGKFLNVGPKRGTLKGDTYMYGEAKLNRDRRLRENVLKREQMAKDMSDRVMEEKERLSLTSGRSRNTSRATSPRSSRYTKSHDERSIRSKAKSDTTRTIVDISLMSFQQNTPRGEDKIDEETEMPGTSKDYPEILVKSQDQDSRKLDMESGDDSTEWKGEGRVEVKQNEPSERDTTGVKKGTKGVKGKGGQTTQSDQVTGGPVGQANQQVTSGMDTSMDKSVVIASSFDEDKPER